jgi:hypothetical protein
MISEWNLSMVKYCANAGEINRIRLRFRLRMRTASKHPNDLE